MARDSCGAGRVDLGESRSAGVPRGIGSQTSLGGRHPRDTRRSRPGGGSAGDDPGFNKLKADLPAVAFQYGGVAVTRDADQLVNLAQMWEAAGRPANKDPSTWRRKAGASFVRDLASELKAPAGLIYWAARGRLPKGGIPQIWAHWQIALAYAKYLSNELHRFVNAAFPRGGG
jgi:hypothetical protein